MQSKQLVILYKSTMRISSFLRLGLAHNCPMVKLRSVSMWTWQAMQIAAVLMAFYTLTGYLLLLSLTIVILKSKEFSKSWQFRLNSNYIQINPTSITSIWTDQFRSRYPQCRSSSRPLKWSSLSSTVDYYRRRHYRYGRDKTRNRTGITLAHVDHYHWCGSSGFQVSGSCFFLDLNCSKP